MINKIFILTFALILQVQASSKEEINDLLSYVKNTKCQYIRNGSSYNGEKAFSHINRKYDYFKDDIHSAEDFIRLSATKSTMFGSLYSIKCPGQKEVKSGDWLLDRLHKYRKLHKAE